MRRWRVEIAGRMLRRLDRREEAAPAYPEALALARTDAERRFLARRLHERPV